MRTDTPVQHGADGSISALVRWEHRRGGLAHCLVRLLRHPDGRVVAVASELASNPEARGVADDVAGLAAVVSRLAREEDGITPEQLVWVAHHGVFSYPDAFDPDTFTLVPLTWTGTEYHDDLSTHRVLDEPAAHSLLGDHQHQDVTALVAALQRG